MRQVWRILSGGFLAICFGLLVIDFVQFMTSGGDATYLSTARLLTPGLIAQVDIWAGQEGTTWGNICRLVLRPLLTATPLWGLALILALGFRVLGRRRP